MAAVTLISPHQRPLRPLVEAAIQNELRLLEAGIQRCEERLRAFEARYGLSSAEFLQRYQEDAFPETLDYVEWVGEQRLLERLREKAETLKAVRFAD